MATIADEVLAFLRKQEDSKRPDELLLYSPDQVKKAIQQVEASRSAQAD